MELRSKGTSTELMELWWCVTEPLETATRSVRVGLSTTNSVHRSACTTRAATEMMRSMALRRFDSSAMERVTDSNMRSWAKHTLHDEGRGVNAE